MTQISKGSDRRNSGRRTQRRTQRQTQKRTQKRSGLLMDFIQAELLIAVAIVAFLAGKKLGENNVREEILAAVQASGSNQIYGAENEIDLLQIVTGGKQEDVVKGGNAAEQGNAADQGNAAEQGAAGGQGEIVDAESSAEVVVKKNSEADDDENEGRTPENDMLRLELLWVDHPELILVNKEHKLPDDYEVELKKLPDGTNKADKLAYDALVTMLKAGRKEGLAFEICSSYRSVERQQELLDEDINALMKKGYTYKEAYAEVTKETMPPGYSEHATGLAFDIVALDYQMLDSNQANTDESKWLRKHCAEYGFILRYPKEKEDVTQISYESWHFRYVGEKAAGYIMENEITLEEYLEEYLDGELDILK